MQTSQKGINFLIQEEGIRYVPYKDIVGYWTIGVGHLITKHPTLPKKWNRRFTKAEVIQLLRDDLKTIEKAINLLINFSLNQNQFDALVSFTFNLGIGSLKRSSIRQKLNNNNVQDALKIWLMYDKAKGLKINALTKRRMREIQLFISKMVV
jgi:lysozyme